MFTLLYSSVGTQSSIYNVVEINKVYSILHPGICQISVFGFSSDKPWSKSPSPSALYPLPKGSCLLPHLDLNAYKQEREAKSQFGFLATHREVPEVPCRRLALADLQISITFLALFEGILGVWKGQEGLERRGMDAVFPTSGSKPVTFSSGSVQFCTWCDG